MKFFHLDLNQSEMKKNSWTNKVILEGKLKFVL